MNQLHNRIAFKPMNPCELSDEDYKKATESLVFLTEKWDVRIKA